MNNCVFHRMSQNTDFPLFSFHSSQPYLCEASYVLLEYARTAMFLWMFIEGLYLHNVVTVTVFQGRFPHLIYAALGWGAPLILAVSFRLFCSIFLFSLFLIKSFSVNLGWVYGQFKLEPEMLVWV